MDKLIAPGPPPHSRRDRVLELLREAGPAGITHRELQERGRVGRALAHVESLIWEGHTIEKLQGECDGLPVTRLLLVKDVWAKPDTSVVFVPVERGAG